MTSRPSCVRPGNRPPASTAKASSNRRASWFGDYNDPSTFTDKYLSTAWRCDGSGAGQRFTVTLPVAEQPVAELPQPAGASA